MAEELKIIEKGIGDLAATLKRTQDDLETKVDVGMLKEAEDRIAKDLTEKLASRQDVEMARKAADACLAKLDEVQTELRRVGSGEKATDASARHRAMLGKFLRAGGVWTDETREYAKTPEYRAMAMHLLGGSDIVEERTLTAAVGPDGGFLVPEVVLNELIYPVLNTSPLRQLARVVQTPGDSIKTFDLTSYPTAYWVGETAAATASQPAFGEINIYAHDMGLKIPVSQKLLETVSNAESIVMDIAARVASQKENTGFITGTGVGQPFGIKTRWTGVAITGEDAGSDLVAANDFYTLAYGNSTTTGLQPYYRANASFLLNSQTLAKVLKLKDNEGNYLWNKDIGLQNGLPPRIAGLPYYIMEDIDNDGTNANNPLFCGDWKSAYWILDRTGIAVLRDPYSAFPVINIHLRKSVGGDMVLAEAARCLVV